MSSYFNTSIKIAQQDTVNDGYICYVDENNGIVKASGKFIKKQRIELSKLTDMTVSANTPQNIPFDSAMMAQGLSWNNSDTVTINRDAVFMIDCAVNVTSSGGATWRFQLNRNGVEMPTFTQQRVGGNQNTNSITASTHCICSHLQNDLITLTAECDNNRTLENVNITLRFVEI